MRSTILASLFVLVLAAPAGASLSDFRLPPASAPQQPPDVQGPVAPDVPASRRPAPATTATVSPAPTLTAEPVDLPESLRTAPSAAPVRPPATERPDSAPISVQPAAVTPTPQESRRIAAPAPSPSARPAATPQPRVDPSTERGWSWLWLAIGLPPLLLALGLASWIVRRTQRRPARADAVPQLERPRLEPPLPAEPVEPATASVEPLQVALEPLRLSLTLLNATLVYRLELANSGTSPLTGLTIGADMIAAHASLSREAQLSGPRAGGSVPTQRIERLEPGESRVVTGEFRLPFPEIVPIRQGSAALLLPLARIRVDAEGVAPILRTFVVGQPGSDPDAGLQPFRLDQGPRVYPQVAQRAFA
ncbi:MAG TPA: hypothetical protein VI168_15285 [Croceibacterium sp.]